MPIGPGLGEYSGFCPDPNLAGDFGNRDLPPGRSRWLHWQKDDQRFRDMLRICCIIIIIICIIICTPVRTDATQIDCAVIMITKRRGNVK
jgi:hypothetical protein